RDAVVLEAPWTCDLGAAALLGPWVPALVRLPDTQRDLVRQLELRTVGLGTLVEQLPGDPAVLRGLCDLVATAGADVVAELATAPVRLVDGRVVHGARGLVLASGAPPGTLEAMMGWGLRVVDPAADHPVLERLGAQRLDAAALARHPVLRERVLEDDDDASRVLLLLVEAAAGAEGPPGRPDGHGPADPAPSWWGEVLLEADDGEPAPARGLVLPGSPAARWFDPAVLPPVSTALVERWAGVLGRVGVRSGLVVERVDALVADTLDGWPEYLDEAGLDDVAPDDAGPSGDGSPDDDEAPLAVADLDAVRREAWPTVLAALAAQGRRALEPVRAPDGHRAPSYTVWWLRHRAGLGLDVPFALRTDAVPGLGPVPPELAGLDETLLRALGGVVGPQDLDADGWAGVLDGLLDAGRATVDVALAVELWRAIGRLVGSAGPDGPDGSPDVARAALAPLADAEQLPALTGREVRLTPTDAVAVADPMWAQHPAVGPVLVVPTALAAPVARALDLDLAAERAAGRVDSRGTSAPVPGPVRTLLAVLGGGAAPTAWWRHEELLVDGERFGWWVADGVVHAEGPDGLACGLAQLAGWPHRDRIARLLADPEALTAVLLELAGHGGPDR
ncbi:MAG TPA: ATP-binding protein, partial [Actinotalea sp.]|nr:ATP-binding protein [Actinotalea sp.]